MIKMEPSIKKEIIELFNKDNNEKNFFVKNKGAWQKITQEEYDNIMRG